jgi:hypothetical protein
MRRRRWRTWALALTGSVLALCAAPEVSSASSSTGPTVVLPKYGFSVTLPSGWQKVTLTQAGINKIAKYVSKTDPALGHEFVNNEATVRHLQLYAIGPPQGGSLPNLNVLVQSPQGLPSGKAFLTQGQPVLKSQLEQAGLKNVVISVVHLPFGSALEGTYTLPGISAPVTQYYVSHNGRLYIITMSPASVVPQIENSWHWR